MERTQRQIAANQPRTIHVGIDVGSTTTKVFVLDPATDDTLYSDYARHGARQMESVRSVLKELADRFPHTRIRAILCGSGGGPIAEALGVPYIQEVVANAIAIRTRHESARCAIELGGQDAKMIFFEHDTNTDRLEVSDMRMNGSCAGGTGAFIDEIAALLKVSVEEFDDLARKGTKVYDISGRCGVYAKTDIQPLPNQGVPKEDLALSAFHAIVKQTLGGLAQGLDIHPPVVFEGGPLTFNPTLIRVFAERLELTRADAVVPDHPETIVAHGAALSLDGLFASDQASLDIPEAVERLKACEQSLAANLTTGKPFFESPDEHDAFTARHRLASIPGPSQQKPGALTVYLGIDSGSTTTKFALVDQNENLVDGFYAPNEGEPLKVAQQALLDLHERYRAQGIELDIAGCGTTGYGEHLFATAFHADYHAVETVAHAKAAAKYVPDASFILDIGGQDMKAIWLDQGIVTDIVVNEACSSGCGSFLENFAASLGIPASEIASAAFRATNPADLGSRCTVFMNSSIVTEQKNGKTPDDIMAGLCRSIIENVFTKVIRISNRESLGSKIVVQGGTLLNDAVLRSLEQYLETDVVRAPYPGIMGAIGIALLTKQQREEAASLSQSTDAADALNRREAIEAERQAAPAVTRPASSFIGLTALKDFSYSQQSNLPCPRCSNRCNRTLVTFSDGTFWITGNRCPRGEATGDPLLDEAHERELADQGPLPEAADLYKVRSELLLQDYPCEKLLADNGVTIGLPRVLSFWDTMPFWTTFFRSLGFTVKVSRESTRPLFERGLASVTSDTICFPAKLVHGHIRDLAFAKVDRIFMPSITTVASENTEKTSESMCAVVKGYPFVVRASDNPAQKWDVAFDDPLFHWYSDSDRTRQLSDYMEETFGIEAETTQAAISQGDRAQRTFRETLLARGSEVIKRVEEEGSYAVVLASRPYHNDPLVNHDLPPMFTKMGIPVLPPDAVPGANEVDLSKSRLDIVNNYHARMLSTALIAAENPALEYAQIVSFGCGHDAYLSDEIIRLMKETSEKMPLILKVDESDIKGPLGIRVRSFVETVNIRRKTEGRRNTRPLPDPYPVKYQPQDRKLKTVLVPNTSHAFCRLMSAAMVKQGIRAEPLEIGREEAIRLGKKYVHNDICFPAQITIGEALAALESGRYDDTRVAIGTGKYIGDCRLTHYCALLRKALDDAGYAHVPIITNDDIDSHNLHPGFKFSLASAIRIAMVLPMIDVLEELLRKMRPYELHPGTAEAAFEAALDAVIEGLQHHGVRGAVKGFEQAITVMKEVRYDRSKPRAQVLIVGEYLLNFHPGANHGIENYLERNGLEIIEARMTDVIRKTYFYKDSQIKLYGVDKPLKEAAWYSIANRLFETAHNVTDRIAVRHPLYVPACRLPELADASDPILHRTFDAGEGIIIPGEILHHASKGCRTFVILQPFGCLPNHVCGRGIVKQLKELYPDAQILALDYDPDASFANIENRLQMLIMNANDKKEAHGSDESAPPSLSASAPPGTSRSAPRSRSATRQSRDGRQPARREKAASRPSRDEAIVRQKHNGAKDLRPMPQNETDDREHAAACAEQENHG